MSVIALLCIKNKTFISIKILLYQDFNVFSFYEHSVQYINVQIFQTDYINFGTIELSVITTILMHLWSHAQTNFKQDIQLSVSLANEY